MKRYDFPLEEGQIDEIINSLKDKEYDCVFLDRALIMQFKALPDQKVITVEDYLTDITTMFLTALNNYEYDLQRENSGTEKPQE